MINSTHNLHIDGTVIDHESLSTALRWDSEDRFTRWVLRPLAILTAVGFITLGVFAGAFMLMMALAMLPLLALAGWALKRKLEASAQPLSADEPLQTES